MAANLIRRYIWEINELNRSQYGMTLAELNERWMNSSLSKDEYGNSDPLIRKTWFIHRKQIASQFGIKIDCDKRSHCYYIADRKESGLPDVQSWLLNSFAVGNMLLQGKDLRDRILYEHIPSGYNFLTVIIEAMRENRILLMTYHGFVSDKEGTFELKPYCLKVFKQRWYLLGENVYKNSVWVYALDRIITLKITDKQFKLPTNFDPESMFAQYYGVSLSDKGTVKTIKLKVYGLQVKYLRSLKLHESQQEIETTPEYSIFKYKLIPTDEFVREILSQGDSVEVMLPIDFRQYVIKCLIGIGKRYGV